MPLKKEPRKRLLFLLPRASAAFSRPKGAGSLCSPKGLLLFCAYRAQGDSIAARQRCILFPALAREGERRARRGTKGGILFSKRIPPLNPPEKGKGRPLRPPTLPVWCLKSCTRCAIGRGVHGFAMNPYYSLPLATAPYYREALSLIHISEPTRRS